MVHMCTRQQKGRREMKNEKKTKTERKYRKNERRSIRTTKKVKRAFAEDAGQVSEGRGCCMLVRAVFL